MDVAITIGAAVVFFLLIMVSVGLHEIGHMAPARLFGVRVPQYSIGFGPKLWSRTFGDTEYALKAFPLGGSVRLLGMYPPASGRPSRWRRLGEWADSAREFEWDEISDIDVTAERLLFQKKVWQRVVIMASGPLMNLLICFVIMWCILGAYGMYQSQPVIAGVSACVKPVTATDQTCTAADPLSPAAAAGLRAGDRVVAFNGVAITSYDQLMSLIRANLDGEARITVERGGVAVELTPVHTMLNQVTDTWDPSVTVSAGFLGVTPTQELVRGGPVEALDQMGTMIGQSAVALVKLPMSVWNVMADLFAGKPRSQTSPMSIVGASWVAGEVVTAEGVDWQAKVVMFASLLASINLFLAVFNFVPLPPLDGGHILGAAWDGLRRLWARLRRKDMPRPFDTAKLLPVAYVVTVFLILCGVALIVADIVSPLRLF